MLVEGWSESPSLFGNDLGFFERVPGCWPEGPTGIPPTPFSHPRLGCKNGAMDAVSASAQCMLRSFVPNIFPKASWYPFSDLQFVMNTGHMVLLLRQKGYLSAWWMATFFAKADALDMGCLTQIPWAMGADE